MSDPPLARARSSFNKDKAIGTFSISPPAQQQQMPSAMQGDAELPAWFTPHRLLAMFCAVHVFVYLDRGKEWSAVFITQHSGTMTASCRAHLEQRSQRIGADREPSRGDWHPRGVQYDLL